MADAITDAMIEAGVEYWHEHSCELLDDMVRGIYLAMEAARQPQLPSDDGLIKALEKARDFLREAPLESGVCCCGDKVEHHSMGSGHSPVDELQYHASNLAEEIDEALSRHKAPLSVPSLTAEEEAMLVEQINGTINLQPVAGDDVERLPPTDSGDGLRLRIAKAISIPQHHTTWDILSEREKDLFLMQADYALTALQVTEGDKR